MAINFEQKVRHDATLLLISSGVLSRKDNLIGNIAGLVGFGRYEINETQITKDLTAKFDSLTMTYGNKGFEARALLNLPNDGTSTQIWDLKKNIKRYARYANGLSVDELVGGPERPNNTSVSSQNQTIPNIQAASQAANFSARDAAADLIAIGVDCKNMKDTGKSGTSIRTNGKALHCQGRS